MSSSGESSKCPVDQKSSGGCPVDHSSSDGCPVDHKSAAINPLTNEYANYSQKPEFNSQDVPLSSDRVISSIPRTDDLIEPPKHQVQAAKEDESKWVYPSEQQYYNAMRRKGFNPKEQDVPYILAIHNAVNEHGWRKVRHWEETLHGSAPRLVRFCGKPDEMSPLAMFRTYLFGYTKPFDRHDWLVERTDPYDGSKKVVRYVLDFYPGTGMDEKKLPAHRSSGLPTKTADSDSANSSGASSSGATSSSSGDGSSYRFPTLNSLLGGLQAQLGGTNSTNNTQNAISSSAQNMGTITTASTALDATSKSAPKSAPITAPSPVSTPPSASEATSPASALAPAPAPAPAVSMFVEVRPALDDVDGLKDRAYMAVGKWLGLVKD